ncbi:MAG TPA: hypothetical protein VHQ90_13095 [Thermoanaerobaculia bacterium]|nr:hypothetical protein [Thermoanaerobaculia bacterium]
MATLTRLSKWVALARIDPGVEIDLSVPSVGKIRGARQTVRQGESVIMVGRGSGLVKGVVLEVHPDFIFTSFIARAGDGGAPVLSDTGELIGILYGADVTKSYVVPIEPILRELDMQLLTE